jgi:predicted small integral membrane protein
VTPKQLGLAAIPLAVAVGVAEIALPCSTWRWPVAAVFIAYSLFAIATVGNEQARPGVSPQARNITVGIGAMGLLSGAFAAVGALC